jgi:hypothetical protein
MLSTVQRSFHVTHVSATSHATKRNGYLQYPGLTTIACSRGPTCTPQPLHYTSELFIFPCVNAYLVYSGLWLAKKEKSRFTPAHWPLRTRSYASMPMALSIHPRSCHCGATLPSGFDIASTINGLGGLQRAISDGCLHFVYIYTERDGSLNRFHPHSHSLLVASNFGSFFHLTGSAF